METFIKKSVEIREINDVVARFEEAPSIIPITWLLLPFYFSILGLKMLDYLKLTFEHNYISLKYDDFHVAI